MKLRVWCACAGWPTTLEGMVQVPHALSITNKLSYRSIVTSIVFYTTSHLDVSDQKLVKLHLDCHMEHVYAGHKAALTLGELALVSFRKEV